MSAITSNWAPIETGVPVTPPVEIGKAYRRKKNFVPLSTIISPDYIADQQVHRTVASGSVGSAVRNGYFSVFRRALLSGRGSGGGFKQGRGLVEHSVTLGRRTVVRHDGAGPFTPSLVRRGRALQWPHRHAAISRSPRRRW